MDIFDVLTMIGGLSLFLFGMNLMGQALERRAGNSLRTLLSKLTSNKAVGFLTGLVVTAVIQSSSATTVMVVGFVNSGLLALGQAINVIMGANVGTTVTAWILSLSSIDSGNVFVQLLKPTSFTPVLALIGIIFYMFCNSSKKKDTGLILLGFATLMFGMDTMSGAVKGLANVPAFQQLFLVFKNPFLGMLAGAVLTAVIQSSSASVGILQALAVTGQVSYGAAIPIIMGQNIGTCVTAMISSVGTTKNARRAALVHLCFNVIGTVVWLVVFAAMQAIFDPVLLHDPASQFGIAVSHSIFNVLCTALLLPCSKLLEKLANKLVPDAKAPETTAQLDERLLATPSIALARCRTVAGEMADASAEVFRSSCGLLTAFSPEMAEQVRQKEDDTDRYEDILGTYLVKLSALQIGDEDSMEAAVLLKAIGDFERIGDHGKNIMESAEELSTKGLRLSDVASQELSVLVAAVDEAVEMSFRAFRDGDMELARQVEPLEEVIDELKEQLRGNHVLRLQQGSCSMETGFVWSDLLTNLERIGDHCSNIASCVLDMQQRSLNTHALLRSARTEPEHFKARYQHYAEKYHI